MFQASTGVNQTQVEAGHEDSHQVPFRAQLLVIEQAKMAFASWILPVDELLTGSGFLLVPGHLLRVSEHVFYVHHRT